MEAGARSESSDRKRNRAISRCEGAKPTEPAEVQFDSPWVRAARLAHRMLRHEQGPSRRHLDIHGGGLDLQFPHHENELAQSESATGQPFARVWMHNGLLKLKNKDGKEQDGRVARKRAPRSRASTHVRRLPPLLHPWYALPLAHRPRHLGLGQPRLAVAEAWSRPRRGTTRSSGSRNGLQRVTEVVRRDRPQGPADSKPRSACGTSNSTTGSAST